MPSRSSLRLTLAAIVGAAAALVGLAAPAQAAACPRGTGVTVVVQGQGLNGTTCLSGGGRGAVSAFRDAGYSLSPVQSQPGFVCQINSRPASDCKNTPPKNAYWGLFWSNGKGGGWVYSSQGVGSLTVPKGGWVAFRFQSSSGTSYPSGRPLAPAPAPKPKPAPAKTATTKPTPAKPSPTTSASGRTATPKSGSSASTPTPGSESTASTPSTSDPGSNEGGQAIDDGSSTSMLWVGGLLAVALLVAVGVIVRARSQRP